MSAISGILGVGNNAGAQNGLDQKADLVGEYQESIFVRNVKGMNAGTTLFGLMSKLKTEPAENSEFNWFERDPVRRELYSGQANYDAILINFFADAARSISGSPYLASGMILYNDRTGEYIKITSADGSIDAANAGTGVSVRRNLNAADATGWTSSQGETGAINSSASGNAVLAGDPWIVVTMGMPEGSTPTRTTYEEPSVLTNFIQTFNSSVEITNAFKANKLRSDKSGPLKARRIQGLERIGKDIELAYLMGKKSRASQSNSIQYFTGGIKHAVDAGGVAAQVLGGSTGDITLSALNTWLETFMVYGSDAKLALCGPRAYSAISRLANSATAGFRIMNQETVWGMNITVINTPYGEIDLAFHPLLKEIPTLNTYLFVVDLAHVVQKTMEPLLLEANIQTPGQDAYKEQFRAKLGLKLRFAQAFAYGKLNTINPAT